MLLISYILGIVTGLILALIVFMVTLHYKPKVERTFNRVSSKLKPKGNIIEPEGEVVDWTETLKTK